jgi:hypothetical protein
LLVKRFALSLVAAFIIAALGVAAHGTLAESTKRLPTFDMKDLDEREHSLSDAEYKDKILLIAGIGTWQNVSVRQAAELEKFHKAHPEVEIIAFVADDLPGARDFVKTQGVTYRCYKADGTAPIGGTFSRLFKLKKSQTLTMNQLPFVILAGKDRTVHFAELGLVDAARLGEELAKFAK